MICFRHRLYNLAFQHWQAFMSLQKEKKSKVQHAVQFGKCLRPAMIACPNLQKQFFVLSNKRKCCDINHHAPSPAHRQLMHLAWNRWNILRELRMKKRLLQSALELKKLTTLQ